MNDNEKLIEELRSTPATGPVSRYLLDRAAAALDCPMSPRPGFRRSEVPEPSAEGPASIAIMPPSPETSMRWYSMYCGVCGIEEMMTAAADDPRLVARRDEHNREHHSEPQADASDEHLMINAHMRQVAHRVMDVFENTDDDTLAGDIMQDVLAAIDILEAFAGDSDLRASGSVR